MAGNDEKKKALDAAIAKLEKDFGKGAVMKLGESGAHVAVETVPTGCLSLDIALGLGGVPKGRVIEVYGPESSGKTTVALHMIAEVPSSLQSPKPDHRCPVGKYIVRQYPLLYSLHRPDPTHVPHQ